MNWFEFGITFHALQIGVILSGIIQFKILDNPSKIFLLYIFLSAVSELVATYTAIHYKNNLLGLNIFSIIEYIITCKYFSVCISNFRRSRLIFLIFLGITIWGISTIIYPLKQALNTPFLVFESITIVALCHYYFYDLLNADDNRVITPSFGFVSFMFIFWSFTFTYWLFGVSIRDHMAEQGKWLSQLIWAINLICYTGFCLVFLFYKKLQNR